MGNLLKILRPPPEPTRMDVFVDFENAQPTESELETYQLVCDFLIRAEEHLTFMGSYPDSIEVVQKSFRFPHNAEYLEAACVELTPLVEDILKCYHFAMELENKIVPLVLTKLCEPSMTPEQHLETQQALTKVFAEILHFTLKFDELKMNKPSITNDFSFFKRLHSKKSSSDMQNRSTVLMDPTNIGKVSLFLAQPTPMLKCISNATKQFVTQNKDWPVENALNCLSTMTRVCRVMLESEVYSVKLSKDIKDFTLHVMCALIILYDHVHPNGAFERKSEIDVKSCLKLLNEYPLSTDSLKNALRYNTRHLNDVSTPKSVRNLLTV